jgi:hypothetical protein
MPNNQFDTTDNLIWQVLSVSHMSAGSPTRHHLQFHRVCIAPTIFRLCHVRSISSIDLDGGASVISVFFCKVSDAPIFTRADICALSDPFTAHNDHSPSNKPSATPKSCSSPSIGLP